MIHESLSDIAITIVSILISLVVHEFMHAYVGFQLGDTTAQQQGRLTLNPLSHIDPLMTVILPIVTIFLFGSPILAAKPVPFNPRVVRFSEFGGALIAIAGPLSNLVLAFIGALIIRGLDPTTFFYHAMDIFITLNVALFVFNILPIPPLDGSRVLYAFAPEPVQELMQAFEPYGLILIFTLVLAGGFGGALTHLNQEVLNLLP